MTPCDFSSLPINDENRQKCLEYCTGANLSPGDTSWINNWTDDIGGCIYAININLFDTNDVEDVGKGEPIPGQFFLDASGFEWSKELMGDTFDKYRSQNFSLPTIPGFPGYNDFQNTIFNVCRSAPGLCTTPLRQVCSPETTETLQINQEKLDWCGCYMNDSEYEVYADRYGVPKECTPICARQSNILLTGPDEIDLLRCDQDICIIDNVTINLADSSVNGISFSQFCGGCSGTGAVTQGVRQDQSSSCQCIIENRTIDAADTEIGGGINLSQDCGDTRCFRTNEEGESLQGSCTTDDDPFQQRMEETEQQQREVLIRNGLIILAVIVLIVFLAIIFGIRT